MTEENNKNIPGVNRSSLIEEDMKDSYLRYSMSVIVSRALPDVRDGLKPVHRRVLFGMHDLGVYPGKPYKKSARIVGDVIGKYHPHGDSAVYETLVRMAQTFSLRCPLVDGQGNFGSIDGDSAAAMRYTEARMSRFAEMMLEDLEKDTVDYSPNYDDSMQEPVVLPSSFPNLIVNGSTGIAVGMATSMAPHNLREVILAIKAVMANPELPDEDLFQFIQGPDFPTGGVICGRSGIRSAYLTGRGKVRVRGRSTIETTAKGRDRIIITEIPYMVNKSNLLEKMAGLIREKKVEGISDLRDESSKTIRIVIELKKDANAEVILNQMYKYTQLQDTFSIYNLALVKKQPTLLTMKALIEYYIEHRLDIITRRTLFELKKAKDRAHILEGLRIAQQNIDEVIAIIKKSPDQSTAKLNLEERFTLSEKQSDAIVSMRLGQLTALDVDKIEREYQDLVVKIEDLEDILAKKERRMAIIEDRLDEINQKYGEDRRTSIEESEDDVDIEDLIADEDQVISLSKIGYIKRVPIDTFKAQGRGGRGISGANLKEEDVVKSLFVARTHDYLLIFTNKGRLHWTKVYKIPESTRTGRGKAIVNIIQLAENETVSAIVPVRTFLAEQNLLFATRSGTVNKMSLELFSRPRRNGINAITLEEDDELVSVVYAQNDDNVLVATRMGQAICFPPSAFRSMGRGTRGVRGIRLQQDDAVIAMTLMQADTMVMTVTENGYCKRTDPAEYRITNRGGKGIRNVAITQKTGLAVKVECVPADFDVIITSKDGVVIRFAVDAVRTVGRNSQGVRAINLRDGDLVIDAAVLPSMGEEREELLAADEEPLEGDALLLAEESDDDEAVDAEILEEDGAEDALPEEEDDEEKE
jgi:DNA gyrase subunit A